MQVEVTHWHLAREALPLVNSPRQLKPTAMQVVDWHLPTTTEAGCGKAQIKMACLHNSHLLEQINLQYEQQMVFSYLVPWVLAQIA